jgi:hypothetical protein
MLWCMQARLWVVAVGVCALGATAVARAQDKPGAPLAGEVLVLLASEGEGAIDPSLNHLRALKHPPFNAFKSIKILSRSALQLEIDKPVELDLPNGRKIHLTLLERQADGRQRVQVSINRPHEKDYLPLLQVIARSGEHFFVAGQKFEGGTLVIGVRVGEHAKPTP